MDERPCRTIEQVHFERRVRELEEAEIARRMQAADLVAQISIEFTNRANV